MFPVYGQQLPPTPPLQAPPMSFPVPTAQSFIRCPFTPQLHKYLLPLPHSSPGSTPTFVIPTSAVDAIISFNKKRIVDRKLRRKAEIHKTIPCRAWKETGRCNYGRRCKFAHGDEDLRKVAKEPVKVFNNPRYRTELCVKYHYLGTCPYGDHCSYIHEQTPKIDLEKCLEELEKSSKLDSPKISTRRSCPKEVQGMLDMDESLSDSVCDGMSSSDCAESSECGSTTMAAIKRNDSEEYADAFHDPFVCGENKKDIELKLLPFMESFLSRPFHVR